MPTVRAFFTNMSVPMPLHSKLRLVFRNQSIKLWRRQDCCGHPESLGVARALRPSLSPTAKREITESDLTT